MPLLLIIMPNSEFILEWRFCTHEFNSYFQLSMGLLLVLLIFLLKFLFIFS